ncbi:sialate O-acetylesterase-like isoform X3 [Mizuhopecten yessoensis]|uniref:sialate O-acetylesterase-like isoform X3 n=1 Tax=Mizuhopecten yessoensis TaxID=6573 RepID=UPI000B45CA0A|nr:sialate O-acetylesterase-like isoform X3 [Mizuhopecten yessoensis]
MMHLGLLFALFFLCIADANRQDVMEMNMPYIAIDESPPLELPKHFSFAAYYGDHMVLQKAPKHAVIWGYNPYTNVFIDVSVDKQTIQAFVDTRGMWRAILDPIEGPGPYTITARGSAGEITLTDVLFGDVWLCSGQSNMQFSVSQGYNASAEIKDADNFPNIRVFTANQISSNKPLSDFDAANSIKEPWSVASSSAIGSGAWKYFSAVCWLYGKYLYQKLGYPVGLVNTCWGGTPVEAWSSPDALAKCGLDNGPVASNGGEPSYSRMSSFGNYGGPQNATILWNAMINPLLNMTIYGAIWYQGENNARNPSTYNCTFPSMISDWRAKFHSSHGQNDPSFPFGFVMLGAYQPSMTVQSGFPDLRWHQTADFGFVPNKKMENVFMSNAMDLPDFTSPYGPIHTQDKQDVAQRLVQGSLAVAYHHKDIVYQAPLPTGYKVDTETQTLELVYNNGSEALQLKNNVGFEVCCSYDGNSICSSHSWWLPASVVKVTRSSVLVTTAVCEPQDVVGIRYAWKVSPCTFKNCAIYSSLSFLPASPFQFTSGKFNKDGSYIIDRSKPHLIG